MNDMKSATVRIVNYFGYLNYDALIGRNPDIAMVTLPTCYSVTHVPTGTAILHVQHRSLAMYAMRRLSRYPWHKAVNDQADNSSLPWRLSALMIIGHIVRLSDRPCWHRRWRRPQRSRYNVWRMN